MSVPWKSAKSVKDFLDSKRLLGKSLKTIKSADKTRVIFPLSASVTRDQIEDALKDMTITASNTSSEVNGISSSFQDIPSHLSRDLRLEEFDFPVCKNRVDGKTGERRLGVRVTEVLKKIIELMGEEGKMFEKSDWEERLPNWKWERHDDLIILPRDPCFRFLEDELGFRKWSEESILALMQAFAPGCRRLAVQGAIHDDDFRSPRLELILGDSTIVRHRDNGIVYEFDAGKCMFSSGNITEKMRVASFDCRGQTVVDLFAGVGYFTLPYLVHAKAAHVIACEWNPYSVHALKKNLLLNNVSDRCTVLIGDNRKTCPEGVAHRLNLGLLPSAEASFSVAARALKKPDSVEDVRWIHVHANVDRETNSKAQTANFSCNKSRIPLTWIDWTEKTRAQFQDLLDLRKWGEEDKEEEERDLNDAVTAFKWSCQIIHCEHVKSYGPKTDHLVLDLMCRPQ